MGRRHRRTGHGLISIVAAQDRRDNQAAGGRDLRLDGEIRSRADAAEGADLVSCGVFCLAVVVRREADGLRGSGNHGLTGFFGDADDRDGVIGQSRGKGAVGSVVVNDGSHSASRGGIGGLHIKVNGAADDQGHFAGEIQAIKVGLFAQTGDGHIFQGLAVQRLQNIIVRLGVVVGSVVVSKTGAVSQLNMIFVVARIVHRGHAHGSRQSGGRGHNGAVGILGQGQLGAGGIVVSRGGFVTGSDHEADAGFFRTGIHAIIGEITVGLLFVLVAVLGKAGRRTQGHVDGVRAQLHGVVQTGQDDIITGGAGVVRKDLHDHELGIGSHTLEVVAVVTGHSTSHVNAVGLPHRLSVGIAMGVVKGEGRLFVHIHLVGIGHAAGQLALQQVGNVALGVLAIGGHHGEGLMILHKAGIQNGHDGAGAVIA